MWEGGAEFLKKRGIKPFMYELFNEPDYDDDYHRGTQGGWRFRGLPWYQT
jgi:hypothetical protein